MSASDMNARNMKYSDMRYSNMNASNMNTSDMNTGDINTGDMNTSNMSTSNINSSNMNSRNMNASNTGTTPLPFEYTGFSLPTTNEEWGVFLDLGCTLDEENLSHPLDTPNLMDIVGKHAAAIRELEESRKRMEDLLVEWGGIKRYLEDLA